MPNNILILGAVIMVGFIGNLFYSKTKIPESLFLMGLGILIGPVFKLVPGSFFLENASFLITLALVVVLLDSGLTLNLYRTIGNVPLAFFFTLLVMLTTTLLVTAITFFIFGWPLMNGIFLGIIGSGTTTITITHLVQKLNAGKNTKTLLVLESVVNDITLITAISVLLAIALPGAGLSALPKAIFNEVVVSILIGVAFAIFWAFLFLRWLPGHKLAYVFTLGLAFIIFDGAEYFGFNGPITVLSFSLFLGNFSFLAKRLKTYSTILRPVSRDILAVRGTNAEITFLMRTLFFVFLGMIFDIGVIGYGIILFAAIIMAAEVLSRYLCAKTLSWIKPRFSPSIPILTNLVASGFTSTLVAFLSIEAGIKIPHLAEIVLLLVFLTTLWAIVSTAIINRRNEAKGIKTY